jgi:tripartite-type tricarboxylate transporter receptor subunit TctC
MTLIHASLTRRALAATAAAALALLPLLPLPAAAQSAWPNHPIKMIVPFAPGGSNDNMARILAAKLGARLGQPVIVENKAGGGGTIGTEFVAKSPADGYTLLFASVSITTNVASGKKLGYDPGKDLEPIGKVAATPFVVVVANEFKANTLAEFIAAAKAKPKSINYGTAGIGGINHLGTEMLASAAKIQLTHVPYKGIGPAFTDLMGGNLQMLLPSLPSVITFVQAGKMRALAVTSAQRSPLAPELPTASEAGLPGFQLEAWFGLLGPAHMPAPIVQRLNENLNAVLVMPEVVEVFAREGAVTQPGKPAEFGSLIKSEMVRWSKLIKDANIQVE